MNKTPLIFVVKNTEQYPKKCFEVVVTGDMDSVVSVSSYAALWVVLAMLYFEPLMLS